MKQIIFHSPTKKHLSLVTLLLITSVLVFLGICAFIMLNPGKFNASQPVSKVKLPQKTIVSHYDIDYPLFHVDTVDALLKNFAIGQELAFAAKIKGKQDDPRDHLTITYGVVHHGARTATVTFHQKESIAGMPDIETQKIMTFDLETQKQLTLTDLFKPNVDARAFIAIMLHDHFKETAEATFSPAELDGLSHMQLTDIQDFWLTDDSVVLAVNPHQVASRQGVKAIAIKRELLGSVLNDEFITADPNTSDVTNTTSSYAITTAPKHVEEIDPNGKMLALTFDDGPGSYTGRVLDALKTSHAHATFFVIGQQVAAYADVERRVIAEGNEIGNHSWNHADLTLLSAAGMRQQVDDTQAAIQVATGGYTPTLMRPPYGSVNGLVTGFLQSQGLREELWSVDTLDWFNRDAQVVYDRIMGSAADGRVILLHDIHPTSVAAVERAIPALIAAGYQLATVSQLIQYRG